uniref:Uncharacterized protein n=1 Tax=Rhizophora mucronata TaxID=61149 RepID=A0A2P2Q178_RHIMU
MVGKRGERREEKREEKKDGDNVRMAIGGGKVLGVWWDFGGL